MKGVRELKISGEVSCKRNLEEAVAPVIALMLILAVVATFISLYSTEYLPGLKEQSEIAQVSEVKEAFMDFSNDIGHIVSEKKGASYGHTIPLGAGDVIMSPEKSSGTLSVSDAGTIFDVYNDSSGDPVASAGMVKAEFKPSYTFWEGQGYSWQYGYINVTKDDIEVPLEDYTMADVTGSEEFSAFAESLIDFEDAGFYNSTSGETELSSLEIDLVTFVQGDKNFVSGNSAAVLKILARENATSFNTSYLSFRFENSTGSDVIPEFSVFLFDKIETEMEALHDSYGNVPSPEVTRVSGGYDTIVLDMSESPSPVLVGIDSLEVVVSTS
ncbi:hypothetical protein Mpet_0371 [Methanolacinia petrolearia DSM 11571]|uniref:Archaeal Type IV pilin N-terminal domain-containing protein n=1 Tax=Methanolacinia petrolearia (strain DSM 11571 / OCM 486 / SEBR 4847) TaxID=679926 RepID=E1RFZ3_METP4|nr:hypothetical protein [Methanolacinia petrolearia]ADN35145.1 hypothetical protein Mpet_0371 [Methanolacinia petrolearia DSM 11571]